MIYPQKGVKKKHKTKEREGVLATFRGFFGDYDPEIAVGDALYRRRISLEKNASAPLSVSL